MTREEALAHLFIQDNIYVYHEDGKDLVNQIFDDFESRTCDNCTLYDGIDYCHWFGRSETKDFCCNKWEEK